MKKALRIILAVALALVIVIFTAWYFFVFDRAFTRDILLQGARFFEDQGNLKVSAWFYDRAYDMVSDNDAVAIELAQQYRDDGNYTKAEYVLSHALEEGASVDLYIALCKTYVEQDKLLDAVNLLDNISNPEIKAQMDALRPKVPTVSPEPGFYNQYISITYTCGEGEKICVNPNGEYPTLYKNTYSEPITLHDGENTLYALSIGEDGLVSPLLISSYTVGGVIELVEFADPAMETAVRSSLGVSEDTQLYTNDLWAITSFTVPADTKDFSDLAYLSYLQELTIANITADNLSAISGMSQLTTLSITNTPVSSEELEVIGSLPKLQKLTLKNCRLTTSAGLANAETLVYLDLQDNTIRDIQALASMEQLTELYLSGNAVVDLSPLTNLKELQILHAARNAIADISPVFGLTKLTQLDISDNKVSDLSGIGNLAQLRIFRAEKNNLTDISKLGLCTKLEEVLVPHNSITDISGLSGLTSLSSLDFSYNQVTSLPNFSKETLLVTINGSYNQIEDLSSLSELPRLNSVYMDYNENLASVEPLAKCPVLILVNVYGTKVTDVSMLTSQSIVVNYDPTQE